MIMNKWLNLGIQNSITMEYRIEKDSLGEVQVPANQYWAAQTQRSLQNFKIGGAADKMPLEMFMGKSVCFDLRHIEDLADVDVKDLEAAEKKSGVKVDGHIVLMCSGLHNKYFPKPEVVWSNWGLTADATHWLADRGSKLHGVEGPSTDKPSHNLFPSHRICRDRGITHYEWLVNLEELIGKGEYMFYGPPLKIDNGSGSPVRAWAVLD